MQGFRGFKEGLRIPTISGSFGRPLEVVSGREFRDRP